MLIFSWMSACDVRAKMLVFFQDLEAQNFLFELIFILISTSEENPDYNNWRTFQKFSELSRTLQICCSQT